MGLVLILLALRMQVRIVQMDTQKQEVVPCYLVGIVDIILLELKRNFVQQMAKLIEIVVVGQNVVSNL
jgi:hypothetical protein